MPLSHGVYESLITAALARELGGVREGSDLRSPLRPAEADDRLSLHVAQVLRRALAALADRDRVPAGVELVRGLLRQLESEGHDVAGELPTEEVLEGLRGFRPDGTPAPIERPLTPLLDTTLLTNARGEPALLHELRSEIPTADRVDALIAFIRVTGLVPLEQSLRQHVDRGRPLRVLTTTYTGSTEQAALDRLRALGAEVRISYETSSTRLHAKAWCFHRNSGFSTAYVGSSNLSHSAQVAGLEWNLRVSGVRNPTVLERMQALFDTYWESEEFVPYDPEQFARLTPEARKPPASALSPIELVLRPFQERLLEQVEMSRRRGRHRNLLVAATGTGKTVMAAVDYARLSQRLQRARLLFVAHRRELLEQARLTFRHALRDAAFGELWVGGERPLAFEHVFASIQSLSKAGFEHLPPDHFDVVVVDEFHHAPAPSYRSLLERIAPRELLGLTATPERADGLDVLEWFGGTIAAELRLWDAIEQQRLVPFLYYGIHDGLDLRDIPWRRGRGYDAEGLTQLYTADDIWARRVFKELERRVADVGSVRALGFCVSVEHARFMARVFCQLGIRAVAVSGETHEEERFSALRDLAARRVNVVFSVDLFNEGVDVPAVDTLLLLRPTDSATLFVQQLGRGLRRHDGKASCLVLDFVGQHRREFRFDRRLSALLGSSRHELAQHVEQGFPFLPAGCHIELDRVAQTIVLENLSAAVGQTPAALAEALRSEASPNLGAFLESSGADLEDIYREGRSWSDLRERAGQPVEPAGPAEGALRRAVGRLLHLDDLERIDVYRRWLGAARPPDVGGVGERERRLLAMLTASLFIRSTVVTKDTSLQQGLEVLWEHGQVRRELLELLDVLKDRIPHVGVELSGHPHVPLRAHARYSRAEIIAAFTPEPKKALVFSWQTGAFMKEDARVHLLPFTLDKTSRGFSPTTRYRDYAVSPRLIHWESQSTTRENGAVGQSYRSGGTDGFDVMLFARPSVEQKAFLFLGPARYVRHSGERPMQIVWALDHALPGDVFSELAAASG